MASRSSRDPNPVTTCRPMTIHPGFAIVMSRPACPRVAPLDRVPWPTSDVRPPSMRQTPSSSGICSPLPFGARHCGLCAHLPQCLLATQKSFSVRRYQRHLGDTDRHWIVNVKLRTVSTVSCFHQRLDRMSGDKHPLRSIPQPLTERYTCSVSIDQTSRCPASGSTKKNLYFLAHKVLVRIPLTTCSDKRPYENDIRPNAHIAPPTSPRPSLASRAKRHPPAATPCAPVA